MSSQYGTLLGVALGALIVGIIVFHESVNPARIFFAALLLAGILGLKFTSGA